MVLATGGVGQVYRFTTNPVEVTADGLAMAARAGARLADLEFVQFHPTALAVDRDPIPLLTEAIRGEGAHLVDDRGERFMAAIHPLAELAPRDIVARGIWERQRRGRQVFLDASASTGERFPQRFPTVFASCRDHSIDPRVEPMPVTPAAHYHMGGVAVDLAGRSSLPGLWACGEVASTGAHGANRLASNSLLEALVFGARVGADLLRERPEAAVSKGSQWAVKGVEPSWPETVLRRQVRRLMWDRVGLVRSADGLRSAEDRLEVLAERFHGGVGEARNLLLAARLITAAASRRKESRGAHFRSDHPEASPADASRHFATMASLLHDDEEAWRVAWRRATGSAR